MNAGEASTPTVATFTADTVQDIETYWPNVCKWMETGEGPKPVVKCTICLESMLLRPGFQERDNSDSTTKYEELLILECDHVLGVDCFKQWIAAWVSGVPAGQENTVASPRCPMCREKMFKTFEGQDDPRWYDRYEMWLSWHQPGDMTLEQKLSEY